MIKIYSDAAFHPNSKLAGVGAIFYFEDSHFTYKEPIGIVKDNHEAEFIALIHILNILIKKEMFNQTIVIYSDSKIAVTSIEKKFVKDEDYGKHLDQILERMDFFQLVFVEWIPEKRNQATDQLAKKALRMN